MPEKKTATTQRFVSRGNFAVMPLSFPGVTVPVDPDESHVTSLDVSADGRLVVGGTSGARAHLFAAFPKPPAGLVMDLGAIDGATETRAVAARGGRVFAAVNGPDGGRLVTQWLPWAVDGIQEWSTWRPPLSALAALPDERILDLYVAPDAKLACCLTSRRVVRVRMDDVVTEMTRDNLSVTFGARDVEDIADAAVRGPAVSRFAVAPDALYAPLEGRMLSRIDPDARAADVTGVELPFERGWGWAHMRDGRHLAAAEDGRLVAFDPAHARAAPAGRAPLGPVTCMAAGADGTVYGLCAEGIGRMFAYDPGRREATDLGAVAGVLGTKRYAYTFADAVTGRDGEIYFAENDRGGHLWVYFPPVA